MMRDDDRLTLFLWMREELTLEYRVNVLRIILPDTDLRTLRFLAALIGGWYTKEGAS